ncbi:MAG: hypothetical protein HY863_07515 [Chloroflexi bacterium]|nr:hypothetical protein [Chloroflexota bacterium]
MKIKLTTFILLLALLLVPTSNAYAQSPNGDVFLLGQNYTLESGKTLDGGLAVIGGNVTIEEDAIVNGDVVLVGGNLSLDGKINGEVVLVGGNLTVTSKIKGNIVVIGGQVLLTKTAVVTGDITTMGGQVEKEPGAEVGGNIVNNAPPIDIPNVPSVPAIPNVPNVPNVPNTPSVDVNINPFWEAAGVLGRAIVIALIGMLLTLFLQPQLERVSDAITQQPLMAGSFGLLTLAVTPIAIIIMAVTILLIPVALIVVLLLPLAWLFGMVALGQEVGERFTKAINQIWAPVLTTGFGTFLLVLIVGFVGMIPCFGWLLSFLVTLLAMGGVVMTLFGSRSAPGKMAINPQIEVIPPAA